MTHRREIETANAPRDEIAASSAANTISRIADLDLSFPDTFIGRASSVDTIDELEGAHRRARARARRVRKEINAEETHYGGPNLLNRAARLRVQH